MKVAVLSSLLFLSTAVNAFLPSPSVPVLGARSGSASPVATITTTGTPVRPSKTAMASAAAPVTTSFVGSKLVRFSLGNRSRSRSWHVRVGLRFVLYDVHTHIYTTERHGAGARGAGQVLPR